MALYKSTIITVIISCHMGSHSDTCHPKQVNAPRLNPAV